MPRQKIPKEYNNGTMTKSAFFSMIRSALRAKSRWWKPILQCKLNARRKYTGANKRLKWEYKCNICKHYFPDKEIAIDHIIPAGTLKDFNDLPTFCRKLFVEIEGLQCVCSACHQFKTNLERKTNK